MSFPGSNFTTISGKVKSFTNGPTTESLMIIGTSQDGPLNTPIPYTDSATFSRVFGPSVYSGNYLNPLTGLADGASAGTTLKNSIDQAISEGATNILIVRASGNYASGTLTNGASSLLDIKSVYPGRIYNQVSLGFVTSGGVLTLSVTVPSNKGLSYITTYASSMTISTFIDTLNADIRNQVVHLNRDTFSQYLNTSVMALAGSASVLTVALTGGTNGCFAQGDDFYTSKDGYATLLAAPVTGTYESIENGSYGFDVAVLTGVYVDDQVVTAGNVGPQGNTWQASDQYGVSAVTDFVLFLDYMSSNIHPCRGVMGLRPPHYSSLNNLVNWVNTSLLSTTAGFYDSNQRWINAGYFLYTGFTKNDPINGNVDMGARLSVVGGPEVVYNSTELGTYSDNFHVSYAAKLTTMAPENAPVFKQLNGPVAYGTVIPAKIAQRLLLGVGYNTATPSVAGGGAYVILTKNPANPGGPLVIYDDVTCSGRDDYQAHDQLVHLCNSIENNINAKLFPYIGGVVSQGILSAMSANVKNILEGYNTSGALAGTKGQGYDYNIGMTASGNSLGTVTVALSITPSSILRRINIALTIRQ